MPIDGKCICRDNRINVNASVLNGRLHINEAMIGNKKWMKQNFTFRIFYYWLKIIGINPLSRMSNDKFVFSYLSLIYGCLLTIIYLYISYLVLMERLTMLLPGETPLSIIIDHMSLTLHFLDISSTWLVFGFNQNGIKHIGKSFVRAERLSKRLEISNDCDKNFRGLEIQLTIVTILYLVWGTFNWASMRGLPDVRHNIWYAYFVSRLVTYNAGTIYVWYLVTVKHTFHRLNDKLRSLIVCYRSGTDEIGRCNSASLSDGLYMICQLHRELRHLVNRIQRYYALFIFFNVLTQIMSITQSLHIMYRYLKHQSEIMELDIAYLIGLSLWVICPLIILAIISNVCGSTAKEANETGNILHSLISSCETFDYTQEAVKLNVTSLDLLQNRVRLSSFGFFDLDSSLVYNTIATVTTYLVIMLQFYG